MNYIKLKVDDLVSLDNYKLRLVKVEPDIYIPNIRAKCLYK